MAVEINNNPNGSDGSGAMTAIVAILVIVVIGLAVYFGFFRGRAVDDGGTDINIDATVPTGSGIDDGPAGGEGGGLY